MIVIKVKRKEAEVASLTTEEAEAAEVKAAIEVAEAEVVLSNTTIMTEMTILNKILTVSHKVKMIAKVYNHNNLIEAEETLEAVLVVAEALVEASKESETLTISNSVNMKENNSKEACHLM